MESRVNCLFRVVIQHFPERTGEDFPYVLIAYNRNTGEALIPSRYSSLQDLLGKFRSAGLPFHEENLVINDTQGPYILFGAEFELNDAQLSILGLKRRPSSL